MNIVLISLLPTRSRETLAMLQRTQISQELTSYYFELICFMLSAISVHSSAYPQTLRCLFLIISVETYNNTLKLSFVELSKSNQI